MVDDNLHGAQSIIDRKPDVSIQTKCRSGSAKSDSQTSRYFNKHSAKTNSFNKLNDEVKASVFPFSAIEKWNWVNIFRFQKTKDGHNFKNIGLRKADDGINLNKNRFPKPTDWHILNFLRVGKFTDGIKINFHRFRKFTDGHNVKNIRFWKSTDTINLYNYGIIIPMKTNIFRVEPFLTSVSYLIKHRGAVF